MARIKINSRIIVLLAIALCSLVVLVYNITRLWGIHDISSEQLDARPHVDMETQLRSNLQNRAGDLAIQLKNERDELLKALVEMQISSETKGSAPIGTESHTTQKATVSVPPAAQVHSSPTRTTETGGIMDGGVHNPLSSMLPGGANHFVLNLDDNALKNTPISEMISHYGPTVGKTPGATCDDDFGNGLVNRWRNTKDTYCSPEGGNVGSVGGFKSKIDCYLVKQTKHGGQGDQICVMENVAVHMDIFDDEKLMNSIVRNYEHTKHAQQPYIKFENGFIKSACKPKVKKWSTPYMPGWNADWTVNSVKQVETSQEVQCDEWIEEPVLVNQRDTFANFFHDSEDFVNVFLALGVLEMSIGETQIYLTDLYPEGPFWDMWKKPFGVGYKPLTAWDLKQRFGHSTPEKKNTCYRKLIVGIYGPASPLTVASWDTGCKSSSLVKAYSDFIIRGMGLHRLSHYAQAKPSKEVQITFMARRSSSEWPEKRFCDDKNSFFLCDIWKNWGLRSLKRTVKNEDELLKGLKDLTQEVFVNGAKIKVVDVDYNLLTFEEQIKIDLQTDIMIGPHGAGLMHSLFMRDRAALVELFVDGSAANRHFHNMAFWYGRPYHGLTGLNLKPEHVLTLVRTVIKNMNLNSY